MTELWQHFASENIFWLGLTLAIYLFGHFLYRKSRFFPLLSPIIVSVVLLIAVLALSDTPYETYFEGAQTIHLPSRSPFRSLISARASFSSSCPL